MDGNIREEIKKSAEYFKKNWIDFAKVLQDVNQSKLFENWGYKSDFEYARKELYIKKETVMKLINSYNYLLEENYDFKSKDSLPSLDSLHELSKLKLKFNDQNNEENSANIYQQVKNEVFDKDLSSSTIKKRVDEFTSDESDESVDEKSGLNAEQRKKALFYLKRLASLLQNQKTPANIINSLEEIAEYFNG